MGRLDGKVALVTGASRGIGEEIAALFAAEGAKVVITARTLKEGGHIYPGSLESTQRRIREAGGECTAVAGNVGKADSCAAIVDAAHKAYGPVDILVNNAAVEWPMPSVKLSPKRWDTTFNICVHGPFYLSQLVLRDDMMPRKSGRIINISSVAALGPGPPLGDDLHRHDDEVCYGACKAAVERMTQGMAAEVSAKRFGGGIAVSCYAPSEVVYTPGVLHNNRGGGKDQGEPVETMARAALLLAAEPVAKVNGAVTYSQRILQDFGYVVKHNGKPAAGAGIDRAGGVTSGYFQATVDKMKRQARL